MGTSCDARFSDWSRYCGLELKHRISPSLPPRLSSANRKVISQAFQEALLASDWQNTRSTKHRFKNLDNWNQAWRSWLPGSQSFLTHLLSFFQPLASQVLAEVRQIIQGKYLVGHSIEHDLCVLQHFGPPAQGIRDTSQFLRWVRNKLWHLS